MMSLLAKLTGSMSVRLQRSMVAAGDWQQKWADVKSKERQQTGVAVND